MKKLFLILPLLLLTACGPNEADFKSTVAPTPKSKIAIVENGSANSNVEQPSEGIPEDEPILNDNPESKTPVDAEEMPVETTVDESAVEPADEPVDVLVEPVTPPPPLPAQINLDVTFYAQAPDGDWGMPWQEACEEASLILAYYYVTDQPLTKAKFKEHIWGLVNWQVEKYNDYIHTEVAKMTEMLEGYFGYKNYEVIDNPTVEDIKRVLASGHPIVAPFAGRELKNPFFTQPGPYYHVIVIKGYDGKNFITNDVGTRRGHNFIYSYQNTMSSMHDYDPDIEIAEGVKRIIIMK
jgi:hypothetical protein